MSRSIDGPECIHGHNLFDPRPCPQCQPNAHPVFSRILDRADFGGIERRLAAHNLGPEFDRIIERAVGRSPIIRIMLIRLTHTNARTH